MRNVVVTGGPRADLAEVDAPAGLGVEYVDHQAYQEGSR